MIGVRGGRLRSQRTIFQSKILIERLLSSFLPLLQAETVLSPHQQKILWVYLRILAAAAEDTLGLPPYSSSSRRYFGFTSVL
jgi:hypothetical protein